MLRVAGIFYGALLISGLGLNAVRGAPLFPIRGGDALLPALALALVLAAATIRFSAFAAERYEWANALEATFQRFLGPLPLRAVLFLAAASSAGEELFFRGALQPALGEVIGGPLALVATSAAFAALHVLPEGGSARYGWTAFAFVLGLCLGALYEWSQSLLPPIALHGVVNAINLRRITRRAGGGTRAV